MTRRIEVRGLVGLAAVALIWAVALGASQLGRKSPEIAVAAVIDLSLTAGAALWWIAVRHGHLPRWTIAATVTAGLAIGRAVLGGSGKGVVMTTAAGIELAMVALTIIGARRAVRSWRMTLGRPRLERFDAALLAVGMPTRVARVVATEVTLFSYAFTGWRAPDDSATRFTVHRVNGWALFAGVLAFLTVVETVVAHIAISAFASPTVAWLVSALSIYGVAWLLGDLHALRHGGVLVTDAGLELAIGVRWSGVIPWSAIASIERGALPEGSGHVDASILGANVIVELNAPCELIGILGRRRVATRVGLSIDDADRFTSLRRSGPGPS